MIYIIRKAEDRWAEWENVIAFTDYDEALDYYSRVESEDSGTDVLWYLDRVKVIGE